MLTRRQMIGWFVGVSMGSLIGAFLWQLRVLQVGMFLSVAGMRRWLASRDGGPAGRANDWPAAANPKVPANPLNSIAMISYHPEYHRFDPALAVASLLACIDLGVGWLRTDIRWNELVPDGINYDSQALAWYRSFLSAASD